MVICILIHRLSSQHKISNGYSGSPVICESTGVVIGMVALEVGGSSSDSYTNYAISVKHILENYKYSIPRANENLVRKMNSKNNKEFIEPEMVFVKELNINIAIYPVTFEEYDLFCEDKLNVRIPSDYNWGRGKKPVIDVSWYDAVKYCKWLNEKSNKNYRLLTSQEWLHISKRDIPNKNFKKYIVHSKTKTKEVATRKSGNLGLYDFIGNTYEWGEDKTIRGISFDDQLTNYQNLFNEIVLQPNTFSFKIGFRVVNIDV